MSTNALRCKLTECDLNTGNVDDHNLYSIIYYCVGLISHFFFFKNVLIKLLNLCSKAFNFILYNFWTKQMKKSKNEIQCNIFTMSISTDNFESKSK